MGSRTFGYIPGNLTGKVAIAILPALELSPSTDSFRESVEWGCFIDSTGDTRTDLGVVPRQ